MVPSRDYIVAKHGVTPEEADEALDDPERVVINPDYNSMSGRSIRIIGCSYSVDELVTVIVMTVDSVTYDVNAWRSNARDRRIYQTGEVR